MKARGDLDTDFWAEKWASDNIAFHKSEPNRLLTRHIDTLSLARGDRVFVPLCGKTLDIGWLLSRGFRVAGVELVDSAVVQLFDELGVEPERMAVGRLVRYRESDIEIFAGDIFDLSLDMLGPVDAVWDRAALVALPAGVRERYTAHLQTITCAAPQLLVTYEYDDRRMEGPPFSVGPDEINRHYAGSYAVERLVTEVVEDRLNGRCDATRSAWRLGRRTD